MSDVLKWLQNMANEEWEYEDGDYALEAIKFFNSLRAENEKLREALIRIDGMATTICMKDDAGYGIRAESVMPIYETARAALEGVTEPASPWRDIESAPKDQIILVVSPFYDKSASTKIVAAFLSEGGWLYAEGFEADPEGPIPTHWMPLPEPPSND